MNKLKNYGLALFAGVGVACTGVSAFAQGTTMTIPTVDGLSASEISTSLASQIGPYILGGIGIGIMVFVVRIGWRWFKNFAH